MLHLYRDPWRPSRFNFSRVLRHRHHCGGPSNALFDCGLGASTHTAHSDRPDSNPKETRTERGHLETFPLRFLRILRILGNPCPSIPHALRPRRCSTCQCQSTQTRKATAAPDANNRSNPPISISPSRPRAASAQRLIPQQRPLGISAAHGFHQDYVKIRSLRSPYRPPPRRSGSHSSRSSPPEIPRSAPLPIFLALPSSLPKSTVPPVC